MRTQTDKNRIDFCRISDRITVGERAIRAVARVSGWRGGRDSAAGGGGAIVRITPVEFTVRDGDGEPYSIRVTDPTREALKWMLSAALGTAAVCWLLTRIVRWIREHGE